MDVLNNVNRFRLSCGLSAVELASKAGLSRQTVYAIEAGSYVPNTTVALKLAQVLGTSVEDLFRLPESEPSAHFEQVEVLAKNAVLRPGQPVQICPIDDRLVATVPELNTWSLPSVDGVVVSHSQAAKHTRVQLLGNQWKAEKRLLIAGCDPAVSVLARYLQRDGIELVVAHQNSSRALELLKRGVVHVAGSHIRDDKTGQSNLSAISSLFRKDSIAVFSFTLWEEGLVVAPGNPKNIRSVADLARKDVNITNRDVGAGSRVLLDSLLARLGISSNMVNGYEHLTPGHFASVKKVRDGKVDCGVNTRTTARVFGLDFVSLVSERYDLVVRKKHLHLPQVQALLDAVTRISLRRELEGIGGYDMAAAGERLM